jgi:hypothetical protein
MRESCILPPPPPFLCAPPVGEMSPIYTGLWAPIGPHSGNYLDFNYWNAMNLVWGQVGGEGGGGLMVWCV